MDTLKAVFRFGNMLHDVWYIERDYLKENPYSRFETVLKSIEEFPDYLDYFPKGAFTRKIKMMFANYNFSSLGETPGLLYFWTKEEYAKYVEDTSKIIYEKIKEKMGLEIL